LLNELKRLIYRKFVADMETGNTDQVTLYANVSGPVIVESPQLAIAFVDPPSTGTYGVAMTFDGTVFLDGDAVEIAFGTSSTEQPTTGWTAATVTGGTWSGVVTPGE
jgi:hypothetical protein